MEVLKDYIPKKFFLKSKGVLGALIAIGGPLMAYLGLDFEWYKAEAGTLYATVSAAVGGIVALWGRIKADSRVVFKK